MSDKEKDVWEGADVWSKVRPWVIRAIDVGATHPVSGVIVLFGVFPACVLLLSERTLRRIFFEEQSEQTLRFAKAIKRGPALVFRIPPSKSS